MMTRKKTLHRLIAIVIGIVMAASAAAQCSQLLITCYDLQTNNCWGCGNNSFWVWQDSAFTPNYAGTCLYCWTGCGSPHELCELYAILIVERCPGEEEFQERFEYVCCTGCGF